MALITYGDIEVKSNELDELDSVLKGLEDKIEEANPCYTIPLLGWVYRKLLGRDIIVLPGDLIGKDVQAKAVSETQELFNKLKGYDSLDESLKSKLKDYHSEFEFTDDKAVTNVAKVYSDLLFRNDLGLSEGSVAGAYTKILSKLQSFAKKRKVELAFVLGNNDLAYHLFKPCYDKLVGLDNLHFIDRTVMTISRKTIGGFGGSPETPAVLKGLGPFVSNTFAHGPGELKDAKIKFMADYADGLDALVVHKAHNDVKPDKVLWGEPLEKYVVFDPNFIPSINELIKHFNPKLVLFGHFHDGFGFSKDGVIYLNPGERQVARTRFFGDPVLLD